MKTVHLNLVLYGVAIVLTLFVHYFAFSNVAMHATLHVFLGMILLYLILFVFIAIFNSSKKK